MKYSFQASLSLGAILISSGQSLLLSLAHANDTVPCAAIVTAQVMRQVDPKVYVAWAFHEGEVYVAMAQIDSDGLLRLQFKLRGSKRIEGFRGKTEFDKMMTHFGSRVKSIQGTWEAQDAVASDNLDAFNRLVAQKVPPQNAAQQTWTGQQCQRHGFMKVTIVKLEGSEGNYHKVVVRFEKEQGS